MQKVACRSRPNVRQKGNHFPQWSIAVQALVSPSLLMLGFHVWFRARVWVLLVATRGVGGFVNYQRRLPYRALPGEYGTLGRLDLTVPPYEFPAVWQVLG